MSDAFTDLPQSSTEKLQCQKSSASRCKFDCINSCLVYILEASLSSSYKWSCKALLMCHCLA